MEGSGEPWCGRHAEVLLPASLEALQYFKQYGLAELSQSLQSAQECPSQVHTPPLSGSSLLEELFVRHNSAWIQQ